MSRCEVFMANYTHQIHVWARKLSQIYHMSSFIFFFYMAITNYFISHYFDLEALTTFNVISGAQTSNATALSWDIFLRDVLIFKSFTPVLDLRYPQALFADLGKTCSDVAGLGEVLARSAQGWRRSHTVSRPPIVACACLQDGDSSVAVAQSRHTMLETQQLL